MGPVGESVSSPNPERREAGELSGRQLLPLADLEHPGVAGRERDGWGEEQEPAPRERERQAGARRRRAAAGEGLRRGRRERREPSEHQEQDAGRAQDRRDEALVRGQLPADRPEHEEPGEAGRPPAGRRGEGAEGRAGAAHRLSAIPFSQVATSASRGMTSRLPFTCAPGIGMGLQPPGWPTVPTGIGVLQYLQKT